MYLEVMLLESVFFPPPNGSKTAVSTPSLVMRTIAA